MKCFIGRLVCLFALPLFPLCAVVPDSAAAGSGATELRALADKIEGELKGDILPFWIRHACDRDKKSFVAELDDLLRVGKSQARGPLLTSRILWTYSSAYRRYKDPAYLSMAKYAYADLERNYWDHEQKGYSWMVDESGKVIDDRKQIYGQSFAIYALAEYHLATGERAPLERAIEVYHLVELHSRDREQGGYLEAFTRDWKRPLFHNLSAIGPDYPKSQNTHLHLMEAYTTLYRAWPDTGLREDLRAIIELMLTRIVSPDGKHLRLYFSENWTPKSKRCSYGHDIEANWLMTQAAEALGDPALLARVHKAVLLLADSTLAEGIDTDGGVFNEGTFDGADDKAKEWWQQAEAVVGFLNSYQISGDKKYLEAACKVWSFTDAKIIDHVNGEWHRAVSQEGEVRHDLAKVSYWKCPYHNGRACMEAVERLRALAVKE